LRFNKEKLSFAESEKSGSRERADEDIDDPLSFIMRADDDAVLTGKNATN
jgi:hypothetical protein